MADAVILAISVVLAVVIVGGAWYFTHKRRQAFRGFARAHALAYAPHDPFGLHAVPFRLFRKGDGRNITNVLWGPWRGQEMRAFDFEYYEEHTAPNRNTARTTHRYSCILLEADASFPHLAIDREGVLTRLAETVGIRDIEFESEEFNRRFQVASVDRKFAYELIDARLMQWLLHLPGNVTFEVLDRWVLLSIKQRLEPVAFAPYIEMALAFRTRIPRVAWSVYGPTESARKELA